MVLCTDQRIFLLSGIFIISTLLDGLKDIRTLKYHENRCLLYRNTTMIIYSNHIGRILPDYGLLCGIGYVSPSTYHNEVVYL